MNKTLKTTCGLALIAVGVIWALLTLDIIEFSFSTQGWWALFIIIPCFYNLLTGKDKGGAVVGVCIGVLLLLGARGIISWDKFWQLGLAALAIGIGVNLLFFKSWEKSHQAEIETINKEGRQIKSIALNFGKQDVSFADEIFEGAEMRVHFGNVNLDLRNAVMERDAFIDIDSAFSGIVIYLPEDAIVKNAISCGFASVNDKRRVKPEPSQDRPIIFLHGNIGFAGVELR